MFEQLECNITPHELAKRELITSFSKSLATYVLDERLPIGKMPDIMSTGKNTKYWERRKSQVTSDEYKEERLQDLMKSNFMIVQNFKKLGDYANERGRPFCCMEAGEVWEGHAGRYEVEGTRVQALRNNVGELIDKITGEKHHSRST